jgi:hypothetical protein
MTSTRQSTAAREAAQERRATERERNTVRRAERHAVRALRIQLSTASDRFIAERSAR